MAIGRLGHNRGYVGPGVEALDEKSAADHKEAFNLIWTDGLDPARQRLADLPGFRAVVQATSTRCWRSDAAASAFALDLGLEEDFFADKIDRPRRPCACCTTRRRARCGGRADGAGTHTDYGNVTLLATDGVAGLQVRRRDGRWVDAPAVPGAFICNIGDCLMRWTNDVYVSTPHRVLQPEASAIRSRCSSTRIPTRSCARFLLACPMASRRVMRRSARTST